MNPSPVGLATYLQTANAIYRTNAANAGLPANFFLLNPGVSGAYVMGRPEDGINSRYDALQVDSDGQCRMAFSCRAATST